MSYVSASRPENTVASRSKLEVADIFRAYGERYRQSRLFSYEQWRVMHDIEVCRTAEIGGHLDVCNSCGFTRPAYNSCRNRHCPKCQGFEQARWIEARKARLLPVPHFHVVFTLPEELRPLAKANRAAIFDMLFDAAAQTLLAFSADEKWIGAQPGLSIVLHTWTRDMLFHPHVHCVISDGGLTRDGPRWVNAKGDGKFIFPVRALSEVFRAKFIEALTRARDAGDLVLVDTSAPLANDANFAAFKDVLFQKPWVVYAKRPFRGAEHVFEYLGRYTHRVAISNQRLVSLADDHVVLRTKKHKTVRLHALEFIRRFLLHVLPAGFVKIRHYGLYASGNVKSRLLQAHALLADDAGPALTASDLAAEAEANPHELLLALTGIDLERCPRCGLGVMCPQPLHSLPLNADPHDPAPPPR